MFRPLVPIGMGFALLCSPCCAQGFNDTALPIEINVFRAASLQAEGIDFGSVLINENPGSITLGTDGSVTTSGGVLSTFGTTQVGRIEVGAYDGASIEVVFDDSAILSGNAGENLTFSPIVDQTQKTVGGQPAEFLFGGTVAFERETLEGQYTGQMSIRVFYR